MLDDEGRTTAWNLFLNTPEPAGYNPAIVPAWTSATCDAFAGLMLEPLRLRVAISPLSPFRQILKWREQESDGI